MKKELMGNQNKFCECGCGQIVKLDNRFIHNHHKPMLGKYKVKPNPQLCKCGCGDLTKPGRQFINGHGRRKNPKPILNHHLCGCGYCDILVASNMRFAYQHGSRKYPKVIQNHHLCECGKCGLMVASNKRFIIGHSSFEENNPMYGVHPTDEQKQNQSNKMKGKPSWCKGLTKETDERVAKIAHKLIGNKGFSGHCHTEETKEKQRIGHINKLVTDETRAKMKESWRTREPTTDETRAKMKESSKNRLPQTIKEKEKRRISVKRYWDSLDETGKGERLKLSAEGRQLKPNKPETIILYLLNLIFPEEWRYTGDFSFTINGKSPDFTNCNGQKKCIEFNGSYWHQNDIPGQRESIFAEFGYDTLIIWEHELKDIENVKSKIIEFHNKPNPYAAHV